MSFRRFAFATRMLLQTWQANAICAESIQFNSSQSNPLFKYRCNLWNHSQDKVVNSLIQLGTFRQFAVTEIHFPEVYGMCDYDSNALITHCCCCGWVLDYISQLMSNWHIRRKKKCNHKMYYKTEYISIEVLEQCHYKKLLWILTSQGASPMQKPHLFFCFCGLNFMRCE